MVGQTYCDPCESKRLLVFGPQALSLDAVGFQTVHSAVTQIRTNSWMLDTIQELPRCWEALTAVFPKYKVIAGEEILVTLKEWFKNGKMEYEWPHLPNIVLAPLVIMWHLTEYTSYVDALSGTGKHGNSPRAASPEVIGLCMGTLSAVAVSLSEGHQQIVRHGASVIRLAMIIGGLVDAQEKLDSQGPSTSFATAWSSPGGKENLHRVLKKFPSAYISVWYDTNRATVTTSWRTESALHAELRREGIIANQIQLHGRFHHRWWESEIDELTKFCGSHPLLQLPDASHLIYPCHSNTVFSSRPEDGLHGHLLRTVLLQQSDWHERLKNLYDSRLAGQACIIETFGPEQCLPPSIMRAIQSNQQTPSTSCVQVKAKNPDDIAVIGLSIKTAGADDANEFWNVLCSGKSQHQEVPPERILFDDQWRNPCRGRQWYGNFINDHDTFDHRFFRKSAKEAASTDPQQRQMLQVAYQALEQAGYFTSPDMDRKVGCYVGVCATDYESNIAAYEPNAYTATGNLRSFIVGKISHFFGWTGPGLCIDTACSSSLVAVHLACKAILNGECNAALAGGVNVMSNSFWFQNLAAASFLSTTGQCKPFGLQADGYCRGEACAAVFLKKMSAAIDNGDQILGTISGSTVYQNQNCTPVFVPNAPSLSDLICDTVKQAKLEPDQITVVEAHGTGTRVGDPAEYDSILHAVGGPQRSNPLVLGSVKGLVGHTECASGVVSLIKSLLMIYHSAITQQPGYELSKPYHDSSPESNIRIPTSLTTWDSEFKAALVNNYGASGSNASVIVTQAPCRLIETTCNAANPVKMQQPLRICGKDDRAIQRYITKLRQYVQSRAGEGLSTADLSFNITRMCNVELGRVLAFSFQSTNELDEKLAAFESTSPDALPIVEPCDRPIVLCFGGQVSLYVGLSQGVYDNVAIFRTYLDECDITCRRMGCDSIFPDIFHTDPIYDPIKLQTMLFAIQYSSAKSWIACGAKPVAVVGHSLGELTAMCISGVVSLPDALQLIIGRASIIKHSWGSEKGSMVAIEGKLDDVERSLAATRVACMAEGETECLPEIACFNSPSNYTIAGTVNSIAVLTGILLEDPTFSNLRFKQLNVTNAFHSSLVEPITKEVEAVGQGIIFNDPMIHFERATEYLSTARLNPKYLADHIRNPVHFSAAIQRLAEKYPSCFWMEAGSNSTVTKMVHKNLESPATSTTSYLQPIDLAHAESPQSITNACINLWKHGITNVTFWPHHRMQTYEYKPLLLPPYQFEKSRHWLDIPQESGNRCSAQEQTALWRFVGYQDAQKQCAQFHINTNHTKYVELVSGHVIFQAAPICPATLQVHLVVESLKTLCQDPDLRPQLYDVENHIPLCIDPQRSVWLEARTIHGSACNWHWKLISKKAQDTSSLMVHTSGHTRFVSTENVEWQAEFSRYSRLTGHGRYKSVYHSEDVKDIIQGRNIYKVFADVVDYSSSYHGLHKLVGKTMESAGRVVMTGNTLNWPDPLLSDAFSQVAGIWVNCMNYTDGDEAYIAVGFEKWTRSPTMNSDGNRLGTYDVLANHGRASDQTFVSDIFIFDSADGSLMEVILGVKYQRVTKSSMRKVISKINCSTPSTEATGSSVEAVSNPSYTPSVTPSIDSNEVHLEQRKRSSGPDLVATVKGILCELSGLEVNKISEKTTLADIGVDSLLGLELCRDLEDIFKCSLPSDEMISVDNFSELIQLLRDKLGVKMASDGYQDMSKEKDGSTASTSTINHQDPAIRDHSDHRPVDWQQVDCTSSGVHNYLELSPSAVVNAFWECNKHTDQLIADHRCTDYINTVLPKQTQLCVALTVEAFETLGCSLQASKPGDALRRITYVPEHRRLVDYLYNMLAREARLVDLVGSTIIRTAVAAPDPSSVIVDELQCSGADHEWPNRLIYFAGRNLAAVLSGKCDGIRLIFGSDEGRELVSGLYRHSPLNRLSLAQMQDILTRILSKIPKDKGILKILELGAGTAATTDGMLELLTRLNVPVEYTFTDLSPSFVAAARKRFKEYPFMKFAVHDIEKSPASDLCNQNIIIASNAIHATHSLAKSLQNIKAALRPDGFLMIQEMTEPMYWVDLVFGLFEGWWLFDDGRQHAIAHQSVWEMDLKSSGYGHVEWTHGQKPEASIQRVFVALAEGPQHSQHKNQTSVAPSLKERGMVPIPGRKEAADNYIRTYTSDFHCSSMSNSVKGTSSNGLSVLLTGGTGSLGAHLVAHLAALPQVQAVICLNRRATTRPDVRQYQALEEKGIYLDAKALSKLRVLQTDTSKPMLGLHENDYNGLLETVTHIIHNAWPMTGKRPLSGMELQFLVMRNLIDLARDISLQRPDYCRVTFQFISSIAVTGHYRLGTERVVVVPEERMTMESVLPNGYGEAKFVCERMLDETLHKYPNRFRTMAIRPGQIAGSKVTGYWNSMEHLPFIIKSSQTLRILPDLDGDLCWTPVDDVAGAISDLLISDCTTHPVYHIDNPVRQPWHTMLLELSNALGIPSSNIVPFKQWAKQVRSFSGNAQWANPAALLIDSLEESFERMSCGGILLDTTKACKDSTTLASVGPVSVELGRKYVEVWKEAGFLSA
ncbi:hypothetical protein BDV26DRAFT_297795 [Aspergillus bertholletiae]|uniref:Polyketide synthase n=1 Tax=Aspergillus bertholletiae TaxID=1226010 RepID=A0A5N7ARN4_9EURO|nr:hypothetical protein BDV26DRAFT_297795 [Aspergillus bertholletiae]